MEWEKEPDEDAELDEELREDAAHHLSTLECQLASLRRSYEELVADEDYDHAKADALLFEMDGLEYAISKLE